MSTRIRVLRLCRTSYIAYTVVSDIEGATVLFDNEDVGTIQNGSFTIRIKEEEDSGNHTVLLQGGQLKAKDTQYNFTAVANSELLPNVVTSDLNVSSYATITSNKIVFTPKHPEQSTVTKDERMITMNTAYTEQQSNVSYTPTTISVETNYTTDNVTIPVELTQNESNKSVTVNLTQEAGAQYEYTINSDLNLATVTLLDGDSEVETGSIANGQCIITLWHDVAKDNMTVRLSGDNSILPPDEETYLFQNNTGTATFPGVGGTFNISDKYSIQSSYSNITYSFPDDKQINRNQTITMNKKATEQNPIQKTYTPTTITLQPTQTQKSGSVTITQEESGKTLVLNYTQTAMVQYSYTVNSDVNGATVMFDGTNVGTIANGTLVVRKWENEAAASYNVTLSGGLPASETTYAFSVSPTSITNFNDKGESRTVTVTSTKSVLSYSHSSGTVSRSSSVTLNKKSNTANSNPTYTSSVSSGTGLSVSGNSITYAANPNKATRSGSVLFTQAESGKTATVSCTQNAKVAYSYTINSNCNGGTVYFNNVSKGTISGGTLTFEDDAASGTVRISGGVPATTQEFVRNDTSTDYDFTASPTSYSWGESGGTQTVTVDSSKKVTTTPVYRDKIYTAPANKTVTGDSSAVTMNYTGPTYGSNYNGTPQEGSWTRVGTYWQYNDPSWISKSSSNYSTYQTKWSFSCSSNSSTSDRSDYDYLIQNETGDKIRFDFSQSAHVPVVEYVFRLRSNTFTTASARPHRYSTDIDYDRDAVCSAGLDTYKTVDGVKTRLGISYSSKDSQIMDYYVTEYSSDNSGYENLSIGFNKSATISTGSTTKSHSITLKQNESGKTITITVKQSGYALSLDASGNKTKTVNIPASGGNGGASFWPVVQSGGKSSDWPSAFPRAGSWIKPNTTDITNGKYFDCNLTANTSTSSRTGTCEISIDEFSTNPFLVITYVQAGVSDTRTFLFSSNNMTYLTVTWPLGVLHGFYGGLCKIKSTSSISGNIKPTVKSTTSGCTATITGPDSSGLYSVDVNLTNDNLTSTTKKYTVTFSQSGNATTLSLTINQPSNYGDEGGDEPGPLNVEDAEYEDVKE